MESTLVLRRKRELIPHLRPETYEHTHSDSNPVLGKAFQSLQPGHYLKIESFKKRGAFGTQLPPQVAQLGAGLHFWGGGHAQLTQVPSHNRGSNSPQ